MQESRRDFVRGLVGTALCLPGLSLVACGAAAASAEGLESEGDTGETGFCTAETGGPAADEANVPRGGDACDYTPNNVEGPFYRADAPERTDVRPADATGLVLTLRGRVTTSDCVPIEGALVDFWQADDTGHYDNDGSNEDVDLDEYRFRGVQSTDAEGRYELLTVLPGRYLNGDNFRPRHIHVKVSSPLSAVVLTTQLYFPDDECTEFDPFVDERLIVTLVDETDEAMSATFDFTVAG